MTQRTTNLVTPRSRPRRGGSASWLLADIGIALTLLGASVWLDAVQLRIGHPPAILPGAPSKLMLQFGSFGRWQSAATLWWVASSVAVLAFVARRRAPVASCAVAGLAIALHLADRRIPATPVDLLAAAALFYAAQVARSRPRSVALLAAAVGACAAATLLSQTGLFNAAPRSSPTWRDFSTDMAIPVLVVLACWFAGDAARARRNELTALRQRAADLERERDHRELLAATIERTRISRELHDVVAHGVSVIVVQAQAAKSVMRRDPARALKALDDVIATGRTSLAELRQLLGLLRADAPAEFSPRVGLTALPALVEQVRNAGLPVDLIIAPPRLALPAALDLSAYRTIQEALTNTLKHAGPGARARVTVRHADDMLSVTVHDSGGRPLADTAADGEQLGHGLHGIRERATAHGGSATVGRHGDGGFCVEVTVPLPITAPAASTA